jgi:hypothetical protein
MFVVRDASDQPVVKLSIMPTELRTNWIYIRVYILWMNMLVMIIIPFVLLFYLNLQVCSSSKICLYIYICVQK